MQQSPAIAPNSLWSAFLPLLPFMLVVFTGYLAMGMALPVVPRHVHGALGQGTAMVGLVMGSQFASSFFARLGAGAIADTRGPRMVTLAGLALASCTGLLYLASVPFMDRPQLATWIVLGGRLLTGVAESFVITGILAWAIARLGPEHAGKVLGWVGISLFGAFGAGAPIGVALQDRFGFAGVAVAAILVPVATLAAAMLMHEEKPTAMPRPPLHHVIGAVKLPGLGLMLCAVGYAMLFAFAVLLFTQRGWGSGAMAVTSMGAGFIVARLLLGHLPDQVGGARVAFFCVIGEALGGLLVWGAPNAVVACAGAALIGGGYGLGFQAFGVEAVRRAPPQSRGAAMGTYVAFQDVAMGLAAPLGGLLAAAAGVHSVYLAVAVASLGAAAVAAVMVRQPPHPLAS